MKPADPDEIAHNEDGISWLARTGPPGRARRQCAAEWGGKPRHLKAVAEHLRPATYEDCEAKGIRDGDGCHAGDDPPDECTCYQIEEGWFFQCPGDHPAAIAVWRLEQKDWGRLKRWHYQLGNRLLGRRWDSPPVLWGGRVERQATWFDRKVLGYTGLYVLASKWHRPWTFWLHCATCGGPRPHYASEGNRGPVCMALDHGERTRAAMRLAG